MEMQSLRVGYNGLSSEQPSGGGADDMLEMEVDPVAMLKPDTSTALVLEVIGLMCDRQYETMQDYLREQSDNFRVSGAVTQWFSIKQISKSQLIHNDHNYFSSISRQSTWWLMWQYSCRSTLIRCALITTNRSKRLSRH